MSNFDLINFDSPLKSSNPYVTNCTTPLEHVPNLIDDSLTSQNEATLTTTTTTTTTINGSSTSLSTNNQTFSNEQSPSSLLDQVDFIEMIQQSTSSDHESEEFNWLCDAKKVIAANPTTSRRFSQQANAQTNNSIKLKSLNNPYKWMTEEFEDKNLDKIKRGLLVALDDISKGLTRRSRSVSMTRKPNVISTHTHYQEQEQEQIDGNNNTNSESIAAMYDNEIKRLAAEVSKNLKINNDLIIKSQSIESLVDLEDNGNSMINSTPKQQTFDSRTITKKKGLQLSTIKRTIDTTMPPPLPQSSSSQYSDFTLLHKSNETLNQPYEDITDVRVVAKMQEENLRKSVMNINKSKSLSGSMNSLVNYQLTATANVSTTKISHALPRTTTTTTTANTKINNSSISKKSLPNSSTTNINNTNSHLIKQLDKNSRSDSVSSEQSISSASVDSPYSSNINVNAFFWDDDFMPRNTEIPNIDNNDLQSLSTLSTNTSHQKQQQQHSSHHQLQQEKKQTHMPPRIVDRKNTIIIKKNTDKLKQQIKNLIGNKSQISQSQRLNHNGSSTGMHSSSSSSNSISSSSQVGMTTASVNKTSSRLITPSPMKHESRLPTPRKASAVNADLLNTTLATQSRSPASGRLHMPNKPPIPTQSQPQSTASKNQFNFSSNSTLSAQRKASNSPAPINKQQTAPSQPQRQLINSSTISRTSTGSSLVNQSSSITTNSSPSGSPLAQPLNQSSPRSRADSPHQQSHKHVFLSPSGLLNDGPIGRRANMSPATTQRLIQDRSISPINLRNNQDSSPQVARKQSAPGGARKSFLPLPATQSQQRPSNSPNRHKALNSHFQSSSWKEGYF